jgi:hypothetical protein
MPDLFSLLFLLQVFLKVDKEYFREDTESKSKGIVEEGLQNG